MVTKFQDLICWQKAIDMTELIYSSTSNLKDLELKSQMRRAASSVMNNIAEGFGRKNRKEMSRFLEFSTSSCLELENMIILMERLQLYESMDLVTIKNKIVETYKVTAGFAKSLNS